MTPQNLKNNHHNVHNTKNHSEQSTPSLSASGLRFNAKQYTRASIMQVGFRHKPAWKATKMQGISLLQIRAEATCSVFSESTPVKEAPGLT